jgi:hypothetical protein
MDIIAEFSDNVGLTCKLTKDRFYVSSLGNEETFALRGVNGIGIYDDLEKYNTELTLFKSQDEKIKNAKNARKIFAYILYFLAAYFVIMGLTSYHEPMSLIFCLIFGGLSSFGAYKLQNSPLDTSLFNIPEPKLETYLRVILSGGERKFLFNKSEGNAVLIADFINKLEQTLTAYN